MNQQEATNPQAMKSENMKLEDMNKVFDLIDKNPFATLITIHDGRPIISHLPLASKKVGDNIELTGHFARTNPHWKSCENSQATMIFHGPHTYITPKWYTQNDVPTWNYLTAHLTGMIELVEDQDEIVESLKAMTNHLERLWPSDWEFFIPDDLKDDHLVKKIVGLKIKIDEIKLKAKLSQNRTPQDRLGILRGLEIRNDESSHLILTEMQNLYQQNGARK